MNPNVESHFARLPEVNIDRSIFDRSHKHITSFNAGEVIPLFVDTVIPGDSVNMTLASVVRAQTLLTPLMDCAYLDTAAFFIPHRLVWNHWREFCGENNNSAWAPSVEYRVPTISAPDGGFETGTLADYFGLPVGVEWDNSAANAPIALPLRAYALVMDQWYRDQNLTDPLNIPFGDANQSGSNGSNYITDVVNGGKPFIAAKFHDYFTSSLPDAQKGDPVQIPVFAGDLPLKTGPAYTPSGRWNVKDPGGSGEWHLDMVVQNGNARVRTDLHDPSGGYYYAAPVGAIPQATGTNLSIVPFSPNNVYADTSAVRTFDVNALRLSFALQRWKEKMARGGSRYPEILLNLYGVVSPDASIQRPEYLGGSRIPLNVQQVSNTAQTSTDFLGDVGAMSVTSDVSDLISKSFTEFGTLLVVGVVRYDHSYPQGLDRMWLQKDFTDYYQPTFANLGEMPVKTCEICATDANMKTDDAFGFQEAWGFMRFKNSRCSGEMRPGIPNTLASWHLADYYSSAPTLSDSWIRESKANIDRTLAVTSEVANQFFGDFYFKCTYTRPMPMYSVPGLIDHM